MNLPLSNQAHWQKIRQQQAVSNAERWIVLLKDSETANNLAIREYDNILRAIEFTLRSEETFDLAIGLIDLLFSPAFDFADWDRWHVYLERALEKSQILDRKDAEASLSEKLGALYFIRGQKEKAEFHLNNCKTIHNREGNNANYAKILTKLATLYTSSGNSQRGLDLCQEALTIAQSTGDDQLVALVELDLSFIYGRIRDQASALKSASHAYQLYKKAGNSKFAVKALINMITAWHHLGMWEEIGNKPQELIDELSEMGDVHILSTLKLNLGVFAYERGDLKIAEEYYHEALHLASQNQNPHHIALIYNNLGKTYTQMEEWESAEEMLLKAVSLFKKLGDNFWLLNSTDNLALAFEAHGKTAVARDILTNALANSSLEDPPPHVQKLIAEMRNRLETYESQPQN